MSGSEGHELILPFVVCYSQGGPYEDESFAAGFAAGMLWEQMAWGLPSADWMTTRTALMPAVDLMAMHYGFRVRVGPSENGWTRFRLEDPNPAEGEES